MAKKSILLAITDPQLLADVAQALGSEWEAYSSADEQEVLAHFEKSSFAAFLVDFNFGSPDASELLNQVLEKYPKTVRFLFSYEADLALVAAKVTGTPQILPKPLELDSLKSRIDSGVADSDPNAAPAEPSQAATEQPAVSPVYGEVLKALDTPGITNKQIGQMIGREATLATEVLKLTNSTHLGLPTDISDPAEAVEALGREPIRAAVLALQFLAEHSRLKSGYLSLDQLWQHSVNVGQIARDLVLFETKDRALAHQALIAGLLHDLGKVVLATNFDDLYGRVNSLARKQPVTLWDVEKEMFGANHGEIGACLLGMWNLPAPIVEAAALHHEPPLGEQQQLGSLAAVHIANVLEHELRPENSDVVVKPVINSQFLNEIGVLQRLPIWRAAFANRRSAGFEADTQTAGEEVEATVLAGTSGSRSANYLPGPSAPTRTGSSGHPEDSSQARPVHSAAYRRGWFYAGAAAVIVCLLSFWFRTQPELTQTPAIYARTPAPARPSATATPVAAVDNNATAEAEQASAVAEESTAPSVPSPVNPAAPASQPAQQRTVAALPALSATNIVQASVPAPEKPAPTFRLNAIIYTAAHPSAIVNGETVSVGDYVNGATVSAIGRTSVTLQVNGQRKTLQLR